MSKQIERLSGMTVKEISTEVKSWKKAELTALVLELVTSSAALNREVKAMKKDLEASNRRINSVRQIVNK